jgi:hypothetical protein
MSVRIMQSLSVVGSVRRFFGQTFGVQALRRRFPGSGLEHKFGGQNMLDQIWRRRVLRCTF